MVVNDRLSKKPKRRVNAELYDFFVFPEDAAEFFGQPFRSSVLTFLSKHARLPFPSSLFPCLLTWQILFRVGHPLAGDDSSPPVIVLDIVEEDVTRSRSVYCDQCRVVGWSGHPVCRKRYHFIIRATSNPMEGYEKPCSLCGNILHLLDSRCKSCNSAVTAEDLEDWIYLQFEDSSHLLHGVVHSNGYGHLLNVNGREGGSKTLSGQDIMNFWDRLCRTLAVRKVSVMDVSRKFGLDYRLLHTVTKGHPWYGDWGYEFGSGSYALTLEAYKKAVDSIRSIPLSLFFFQGRQPPSRLQAVIAFYQSLSDSELLTLKDLFSFILSLIHITRGRISPKSTLKKSEPHTSKILCAWTRSDVERVEAVMVKVLLAAAGNATWVTRRSLKGATWKVASPQLLDYCLNHLPGKVLSNGMAVQCRCSADSNAVEYRIQSQSSDDRVPSLEAKYPSEEHLVRDLKFLYECILHPQTMVKYKRQLTSETVADAVAKLLDCKQFVKDYRPSEALAANPFSFCLWCHVEVTDDPTEDAPPPPELIVLPLNATVADLKNEATKAFQEVYALFKRFYVEELPEYGPVEDAMTLSLLAASGGSIVVQGKCPGKHTLNRYRMERGTESWTVDCACGAMDDDGERMLACDTCGVWQHTRCAGIDNFEAIPAKFVCTRCVNTPHHEPEPESVPKSSQESKDDPLTVSSSTTCRDEAKHIIASNVGSCVGT